MQLEFCIDPAGRDGDGYNVVRVSDKQVLTTVPTAGAAAQYIHDLKLSRRYDAERDGSAYIKPEQTSDVTDEMIAALEAIENDESRRAALRISKVTDPVTITHQASWDEYVAGNVEITHTYAEVTSDTGPLGLYICGEHMDMPITYKLLTGLMINLAHLLSNDQVLAALGQPPMDAPRTP